MRFLLLPLLLFSVNFLSAQCKTFKLAGNGDTLNCIDIKGLKQGKWIIATPKLRGEPGFETEGVFIDDRKEGTWRSFNLMGDLIAQENYRWGNLHGKSMYFTIAGLEREESWRAVNPDKAYDTLDVVDPANPNQYERIVVKNDGNSIKHGIWRTYYPSTGALIEAQEYIMGQLKEERAANSSFNNPTKTITNQAAVSKTGSKDSLEKNKVKILPKEVAAFEKSNKKKKMITGKTSIKQ